MRIARFSAFVLFVSVLGGEDFDTKYQRLIPHDAKVVFGFKPERVDTSALMTLPRPGGLGAREGVTEIMVVTRTTSGGDLKITHGFLPPVPPPESEVEVSFCPASTRLTPTTEIAGIPDEVEAAMSRWNQQDAGAHPIAQTVEQLRNSYDIWFVAIRPLDLHVQTSEAPMKHRDEIVKVIEELRGGIRFGGINRVVLEATTRSVEDATGLAAVGRWLPGLIQLAGAGEEAAALLDLVDDYSSLSAGTQVRITFSIDESRVKELLERLKARRDVPAAIP